MRCYTSVVIRILWDDELNSLLEGQISHVGTQETAYFRDLDKAKEFIQDHLPDHLSGLGQDMSEFERDARADSPTTLPGGDGEDLRRG